MKRPADIYIPSSKPFFGLPELSYPLHDREALVTACGRICMHRKKINVSTVLAGQKLGIKEIDEGIWLISFMHYDLGYIDLEQKTLQPIDNPFGTRLSPMSQERDVTHVSGSDRAKLERAKGFEPSTPTLAKLHSSYARVSIPALEHYDRLIFTLPEQCRVRHFILL